MAGSVADDVARSGADPAWPVGGANMSEPQEGASESNVSAPGSRRLGARRFQVGPRQAGGGPQALEHGVGHVVEAVAVSEVVATAAPLVGQPGPFGPAHRIGVPGGELLEIEVAVGGRFAKRRIP